MDRADHKLLIACARVCSHEEREGLIRSSLNEPIDWKYLLNVSSQHSLTSLLHWHLNKTGLDCVPKPIVIRLRKHFIANSKRTLVLTAKLLRILELFRNNGIPAIPFKGPILAQTLYDIPDLREFSDLDILVQEPSVFKALRLLPTIGYKKITNYSPAVEEQILKREYHFQIEEENGTDFIEIHWNVAPHYLAFPLRIQNWWERVDTVLIPPRSIPNLSGEDLLMALSAHGSRHMWASLGWIADITRLLHKYPQLDWDYIFAEYDHPDLRRVLFLALNVAHEVLNGDVPQEILYKIKRDRTVNELTRQIRQNLFSGLGEQEGLPHIVFHLRLKSSWINRMRLCFRVVSTPTLLEWKIPLPRLLFPLYFVLRPFRLLWKHLLARKNQIDS